jgi:hypothetical protein
MWVRETLTKEDISSAAGAGIVGLDEMGQLRGEQGELFEELG